MRRVIAIAFIFVLSVMAIFYSHFYIKQRVYEKSFGNLSDHQIVKLELTSATLSVEIVNTKESRNKGLSERDEIGSDGMLFIFQNKQKLQFWMKEMNFDLDMIWFADGEVIEITKNIKALNNSVVTDSLQTYSPSHLADMILEVPAGDSDRLGISVGDKIRAISSL